MLFHPAIIALLAGSLILGGLLLYAAFFALRILTHWDLASGSEMQLSLERRTYLLATVMVWACVFQLLSLFLFIQTVDSLCTLFSGAMCAAGTLNLNRFGYPVLLLKIVNFLLAGLWLIINHADNQGYDYPLLRSKYRLLLLLAPLLVLEGVLQGSFFLSLRPHVITSCCGSLFGSTTSGFLPSLSSLPPLPLLRVLAVVLLGTLLIGAIYWRWQRGGYLFAVTAGMTFCLGSAALVIAIPLYIYALPTHHCPFCMLHREYGHVGYLLYLTLLGGGLCGIGVGALQPFRRIASLEIALPVIQRRLTILALLSFALFGMATLWQVMTSELSLG